MKIYYEKQNYRNQRNSLVFNGTHVHITFEILYFVVLVVQDKPIIFQN